MFVGFIFCNTLVTSNNIPYRVMSGIIFSTNQSTTSLPNHTTRTAFQLVNIFKCLAFDWTVKDE